MMPGADMAHAEPETRRGARSLCLFLGDAPSRRSAASVWCAFSSSEDRGPGFGHGLQMQARGLRRPRDGAVLKTSRQASPRVHESKVVLESTDERKRATAHTKWPLRIQWFETSLTPQLQHMCAKSLLPRNGTVTTTPAHHTRDTVRTRQLGAMSCDVDAQVVSGESGVGNRPVRHARHSSRLMNAFLPLWITHTSGSPSVIWRPPPHRPCVGPGLHTTVACNPRKAGCVRRYLHCLFVQAERHVGLGRVPRRTPSRLTEGSLARECVSEQLSRLGVVAQVQRCLHRIRRIRASIN